MTLTEARVLAEALRNMVQRGAYVRVVATDENRPVGDLQYDVEISKGPKARPDVIVHVQQAGVFLRKKE